VAALVASSVVAILPCQEIYHLVRNSDDKTVVKITNLFLQWHCRSLSWNSFCKSCQALHYVYG